MDPIHHEDRSSALRKIALARIGLTTDARDHSLDRILNLAQRAMGCDGVRFSILEEGQFCTVSETPGARGCHIEDSSIVHHTVDSGEPYFNPDIANNPEPSLSHARLGDQPLGACCMLPVLSPDRRPIGAVCMFGAKAHHGINVDEQRDLLNTYVRLIEDSLLLRSLSVRDPLTNLFNRRYFEDQTRVEWRRALRMQVPMSFAMVDIDHFKKFNDSAGHHAGDDALESVARVLRESFKRAGDVVCRFGGEEFAVLLPTTPAHGAMSRLKRTHELLHDMAISHPGTGGLLTLSCGVSTADTVEALEKGTLESFLSDADRALYAAKSGGRNRSCHFKDLSEDRVREVTAELAGRSPAPSA